MEETNKPDEVVKDLEYFLDKVAIEWGYSDYNRCCVINSDNDEDDIKLQASLRWYKHQLEEKDKFINSLIEGVKQGNEMYNYILECDIKQLRTTIQQQNHEIEGHQQLFISYKKAIDKLTQENELLKNK